MNEPTTPELDVTDLMQRVRAEAAEMAQRTPDRHGQSDAVPTSSAPVPGLTHPPALPAMRPVNLKRERLHELLRQASESTGVASWVPKPLRGLFRKQGTFNRAVIDAITSLVKTNTELTNRVHDLSLALDVQTRWLNLMADGRIALQGQLDRLGAHVLNLQNEVDASGARAHLAALQGQLDRLGAHVVNLQNEVDATGARAHRAALQGQLDRLGAHVVNLQNEVDASGVRTHLAALQGQLDRLGAHVVNLQDEVNAVREPSRSWADPLRAVERHAEQLGLQINHLQLEIGKSQGETRFVQRAFDDLAAKRSNIEQQLMRLDERQADDAKFIKAIVAEHAALLQRFAASDDPALLQQ
jgi:chromosome segregation ATPase